MEEYIVEPNDTLISISFKFNIRLYQILQLNSLSEESIIVPGMKIRLKSFPKRSGFSQSNPDSLTFQTSYCTGKEEVEGNLIISHFSVVFQPIKIINIGKKKTNQNIRKFEIFIDIGDIYQVNILDNPDLKPREHILLIQLLVTSTGDKKEYEFNRVLGC